MLSKILSSGVNFAYRNVNPIASAGNLLNNTGVLGWIGNKIMENPSVSNFVTKYGLDKTNIDYKGLSVGTLDLIAGIANNNAQNKNREFQEKILAQLLSNVTIPEEERAAEISDAISADKSIGGRGIVDNNNALSSTVAKMLQQERLNKSNLGVALLSLLSGMNSNNYYNANTINPMALAGTDNNNNNNQSNKVQNG
ncbi:MAG: hypothetical protein ACRCXT_00445 [Paraclostridium sp.]